MEHILEKEVDRVNSLFLARQDTKLNLLKGGFGATKGLGVKSLGLHQTNINPKHRKKRGQRMNNEALQDLDQILLNSGKMKALEAFTLPS